MVNSKLIWIDSDENIKKIRSEMIFEHILMIGGSILFTVILILVGLWFVSVVLLIFSLYVIKNLIRRYPYPLEIYNDKIVYWHNLTQSSEYERYEKRTIFYHDIEYVGNLIIEEIKIPIINNKVYRKWFSIKLINGKEIRLSGRYITVIESAHSQFRKQYDTYKLS